MHIILLEVNAKNIIESQKRLNPITKELGKKEIKWLDDGIIYPISNCVWVSLIQCVPKKGGMAIIKNENKGLISIRTIIGWRIYMDYRKLNKANRKDDFPLPFIDQILNKLDSKELYYFLDGYARTFDFKRIPFGLCNAPTTFQ